MWKICERPQRTTTASPMGVHGVLPRFMTPFMFDMSSSTACKWRFILGSYEAAKNGSRWDAKSELVPLREEMVAKQDLFLSVLFFTNMTRSPRSSTARPIHSWALFLSHPREHDTPRNFSLPNLQMVRPSIVISMPCFGCRGVVVLHLCK